MAERRRRNTEPETMADVEQMDAEASPSLGSRVGRIFGRRTDAAPKERKTQPRIPAGHPDETELTELVSLANMPVALMSPRDCLTPWETQRLVDALKTYTDKDDRARRWLYGISRKSALLILLDTVAMLAIPRMIRHGWLPASIAPYVAARVDSLQLADATGMTPEDLRRAMETSPAPSPNGQHPDTSRPADIPVRPVPGPVPGGSYEAI